MASPSNASEPESPDEEEIIDAGFDPLLFWDQYRQIILLVAGVLLLAAVGFGVYEYNSSQRITAAGAALAQASTDDNYRQIIDKYSGTVAAGDASLLLAAKLRDEKKFDDAIQVLQTFLDKYPTHPLAHAGDLSIAETLELQGKTDDAIAKYQEVTAKYPDSYSAPLAVIAQANILKKQGKTDEAKRLYENFVAQFPDSIFTQQAMSEMHLLRPAAGTPPAPAPQSDTDAIKSLLEQAAAKAKAASPAPSASAPITPAIPAASPH
jgi:predicted negative regulator of RcsB-dependent stress response